MNVTTNNSTISTNHPGLTPATASPMSPTGRTVAARLVAAIAAGSLILASCGDSDDTPASEPAAVSEPGADTAGDEPAGGDTAASVSTGSTPLGDALVDGSGLTLYGFTNDVDGIPTCSDGCAQAWPPVIVADGQVPAGLDAAVFSVVARDDGSMQLVAGQWPLYTFAGDAAPGDVNGQESGGVWFVAAPDGSLIGVAAGAATPNIDSAGEGY